MLLGAAKHLAEMGNFAGTIHFIFQPAEENEGGARVMIEEGVLEKYPVDAVYGMHNWPELPIGQFAIQSGPMMAAFDIFEITIEGRGGPCGDAASCGRSGRCRGADCQPQHPSA